MATYLMGIYLREQEQGNFTISCTPIFLFLGCGVFFRARALLGRLVFYLRSQGFRARAFLWDLGDDKRQGPYSYLNFASTSLRNYFKIIRPRGKGKFKR